MIYFLLALTHLLFIIGFVIIYKAIIKSQKEYLWSKQMARIYKDPRLEKEHIKRRINVLFNLGILALVLWAIIIFYLIRLIL